jgi:hypothetical protein
MLSDYSGFIPLGNFGLQPDNRRPEPETLERYSDAQLFALAKFIYSLTPPVNPNPVNGSSRRGERVFVREGCPGCHTPPLYTNNKLTIAEGYRPPYNASANHDIMAISVGTDPDLAMRTRRGTGYYKVPSLKGVWYRSMLAIVAGARLWKIGLTRSERRKTMFPPDSSHTGRRPLP